MERENFPQYYTILFNGIADALKDAYIRAEET